MNIELLKRTAAYMLQYPEGVDMRRWATGTYVADKENGPPCGTTACIAGTAWALEHGATQADGRGYLMNTDSLKFQKLLDLDIFQADRLFSHWAWPDVFHERYILATAAQTRAQVVHDRIHHFIATEGRE